MKRKKRHCRFLFGCVLFCFTMLLLAACGKGEAEEDAPQIVPVIVAREKLSGVSRAGTLLVNGILYYSHSDADGTQERIVYRKREGQEAEALASFSLADEMLFHYLADGEGGVYYVYCQAQKEGEEVSFSVFLRKDNAAGKEVYRTLLDRENVSVSGKEESVWKVFPESAGKWFGINAGIADGEGRVCLYNDREKLLYLFDAAGNFTGKADCPPVEKEEAESPSGAGSLPGESKEGLFQTGDDCYFYSLGQKKAAIRKIDFCTGELSDWEDLPFLPEDIVFLSGDSGEEGSILVGTGKALYLYSLAAAGKEQAVGVPEEREELLNWSDLLLQGREIQRVRRDGEGYQALCYKNSALRLLRIENRDANLSEKQIVRLGVYEYVHENDIVRQLAAAFNDSSLLYQVEVVPYGRDAVVGDSLYLQLLKGEGPDIFELQGLNLPIKDLASKGVFADLTPYLEQSAVVGKEDILPRIIEAGSFGEKLVNLIPLFNIKTMVIRQGYTKDGGWTRDDFFAYCREHQELYNIKDLFIKHRSKS